MIAKQTGVPQALHGASGLSNADLTAAVKAGIAKVYITLSCAERFIHAGRRVARRPDDVRVLQRKAIAAMAEVAAEKLTVLGRHGAERKDDR